MLEICCSWCIHIHWIYPTQSPHQPYLRRHRSGSLKKIKPLLCAVLNTINPLWLSTHGIDIFHILQNTKKASDIFYLHPFVWYSVRLIQIVMYACRCARYAFYADILFFYRKHSLSVQDQLVNNPICKECAHIKLAMENVFIEGKICMYGMKNIIFHGIIIIGNVINNPCLSYTLIRNHSINNTVLCNHSSMP